jgi:hypothetical protein
VGFCEYGDETLDPVTAGNFLAGRVTGQGNSAVIYLEFSNF